MITDIVIQVMIINVVISLLVYILYTYLKNKLNFIRLYSVLESLYLQLVPSEFLKTKFDEELIYTFILGNFECQLNNNNMSLPTKYTLLH